MVHPPSPRLLDPLFWTLWPRWRSTAEQFQDVLVPFAAIVGTARVMTAAGDIARALGIAITEAEAQARG